MELVAITSERKSQLEDYAWQHGQNTAEVLDEALAVWLDWKNQDFAEAVEGIRKGYEDVKAGRTRPAVEFLSEVRRKYH